MAKIIEFPSGNQNRHDVEETSSDTENAQRLYECKIPDLRSMYDESVVTMLGTEMSVTEFRTTILGALSNDPKVSKNVEAQLEVALATERAKMIALNLKTQKNKAKAAMSELGRVTYAVGMRLDHDEIMDMGRFVLTQAMGQRRALITIQNMRIASQVDPQKPFVQEPASPIPLGRPNLRLV